MPATKEDVLKALARVPDPASGRDVVAAGMVQGLVIRNGNVGFAIEVAPERGRSAEPLRKAAEDAVANLPGVLSVSAVLTAHQDKSAAPPRTAPPQQTRQTGIAG